MRNNTHSKFWLHLGNVFVRFRWPNVWRAMVYLTIISRAWINGLWVNSPWGQRPNGGQSSKSAKHRLPAISAASNIWKNNDNHQLYDKLVHLHNILVQPELSICDTDQDNQCFVDENDPYFAGDKFLWQLCRQQTPCPPPLWFAFECVRPF